MEKYIIICQLYFNWKSNRQAMKYLSEVGKKNLKRREWSKRYEKTKKGFLVRAYRNMKSRINGIQKTKHHLYRGKYILDKDQFYKWSLENKDFHRLFKTWEGSNYDRKFTPSIDRIDPEIGYEVDNMQWITFSENCSRGGKWKPQKQR